MSVRINTQVDSSVGGDVNNRYDGALPTGNAQPQEINSQRRVVIAGNLRNEVVSRGTQKDPPTSSGIAKTVIPFAWKNIPVVNALLQLVGKALHHLVG
jgi:hypothetical protein